MQDLPMAIVHILGACLVAGVVIFVNFYWGSESAFVGLVCAVWFLLKVLEKESWI